MKVGAIAVALIVSGYAVMWCVLGVIRPEVLEPHSALYQHLFQKLPFDSKLWKESAQHDRSNPIRLRMVNSLLAQHELVGMTRLEVEQLLGRPDANPFGTQYGFDTGYWLGPSHDALHMLIPALGIDSLWLCLKFRENKVAELSILDDD